MGPGEEAAPSAEGQWARSASPARCTLPLDEAVEAMEALHRDEDNNGEELGPTMRPQHEEEEGHGRLPSLDRTEASADSAGSCDMDDDEPTTVPLHELHGAGAPLPPPILSGLPPRLLTRLMGRPPRIWGGRPRPSAEAGAETASKLSRMDEDERTLASSASSRLSRIDEAPRGPSRAKGGEGGPRSAVQRLAGVLLAACALGGLTRHQFAPHDHPTLQVPTMPPAATLANSTRLLLRQIELESQLAELERNTSHEESNSRRRVALLAELLRSHRASAVLDGAADADEAIADVEKRLRGAAKFGVGEAVEQVYNANTWRNRMLYPYRVEDAAYVEEASDADVARAERRIQRLNDDDKFVEEDDGDEPMLEDDGSDDDGDMDAPSLLDAGSGMRYTLVRLLDGVVVRNVPESFLRKYEPYAPRTRALCDTGDADYGQVVTTPCRVVEYLPPEYEGEGDDDAYVRVKREAVQAEYRVTIRRPEGEEVEFRLPVGKLQRHS